MLPVLIKGTVRADVSALTITLSVTGLLKGRENRKKMCVLCGSRIKGAVLHSILYVYVQVQGSVASL